MADSKRPRILSPLWLPKVPRGALKRITVHWTGGATYPSAEDLASYNLLCDRVGHFHLGDHPITDQISTADDDYAAHTLRFNTGNIGFAYCGMAGANEKPFAPGPFPIQKAQWNSGLVGLADLCRWFDFPPDEEHLGMHCEVERIHGVSQRSKWDISVLCFDRGKYASMTPGDEMRARVKLLLAEV